MAWSAVALLVLLSLTSPSRLAQQTGAAQTLHSEIPSSIVSSCVLQSNPTNQAQAEYQCKTTSENHVRQSWIITYTPTTP